MAYFKNLLLIDDDDVSNYLHQWWAERYNLAENIVACVSPKQAIAYIDENGFGSSPDLMLVDLNMPVMDGFELLDEIFSTPGFLGKHAYLFILTSSMLDADIEKAARLPIRGCLSKPLDDKQMRKLLQAIQSEE